MTIAVDLGFKTKSIFREDAIFLENITCDLSIYTMDHPNFSNVALRPPRGVCAPLIPENNAELSETQNYAYWYTRFFPGTHDFR